jgi:formylglycine-generating enzyme required for sulfatase activity
MKDMRVAGIVLWAALAMGLQAAEVWEATPAPGGATNETRTVRIVKQGMEHARNNDGSSFSIGSFHRYRVITNANGMLEAFLARDDRQLFHDYDVDGDGIATNDTVESHIFSLTESLTPNAPFYDRSVGSQRIFGGLSIYTAGTQDPEGFSEDGLNDLEEGLENQPRRNWTYFNEMYDIYHPYKAYGVWVWQKEDFLNGGADYPVSFDTNSVLAHLVMRYWMGVEGLRWVVRNNDQFYISEDTYQYADETPGSLGGKVHQLVPSETLWAEYNPGSPSAHLIHFDTNSASYSARSFTNVTGVGYYLFREKLISGYLGYKWYTFEARATVTKPKRPSESLNMIEVPGAGGVQDFYMAVCETPYEQWRRVERLMNNNVFCMEPRSITLDNGADMGSMDYPDATGTYKSHSVHEPATDVTLHDVIAWCNALSVMESREPVYYEDASFSNLFMNVVMSPLYLSQRATPDIYVKWDADGYRLPTPKEWERAHSAGSQQYTTTYGWIGSNASGTTHTVGGLTTNALGIYDMAGNVWELTWNFGDMLDSSANSDLLVLGGGLHYPANPTNYSASAYGDRPYGGSYNVGFRLVRREAGLADPDTSTSVSGMPQWTIAATDQSAAVPSLQLSAPLASNWITQISVPGTNYAMGATEVTFAQWQPVFDWAEANGYTFDDDADMGSMSYWGWGTNAPPATHEPDEPATGMTRYDAIVWLNALSELESKTPVYCADEALTTAVSTAITYRAPMVTLGEQFAEIDADEFMLPGEARNWFRALYHINSAADGYRLPEHEEFFHVAHAGGSTKYPWGTDVTATTNHTWMLDNSGLSTHPVGLKQTNAWGFADMVGNVAEWSETLNENNAGAYADRLGLGFFDLSGGYPNVAPTETHCGLSYPDVGLRVLKQNP